MIFGDRVLVIDAVTDATETAASGEIAFPVARQHQDGFTWGERLKVSGAVLRRLYDSPSAESYGDGSYTVNRADYDAAVVPHRVR
jgi:hypothetical protein